MLRPISLCVALGLASCAGDPAASESVTSQPTSAASDPMAPASSQPTSHPTSKPADDSGRQGFLVGVITLDDSTAFFKLQGPAGKVSALRAPFRALCESLKNESELSWTTPEQFSEQPASGMRKAAFEAAGDPAVTATLIVMGGNAGGLGPNVGRWRGQIGLPMLGTSGMDAFLEKQERFETSGGLPVVLVDLTGTE